MNKITERKSTLEGINGRLNDSEEWTSEWKTEERESLSPKRKKGMRTV